VVTLNKLISDVVKSFSVLERLMPLPEEATGDINAHFVNGRLHLRW